MDKSLTTNSIQETQELASQLAEELLKQEGPVIIGLFGNLGSGKTTFAQGLIQALGVAGRITSPTFVLMKLYNLDASSKFKKVVHLDLYRLEKQEQIDSLGLEDYFSDQENIILIEWADRLKGKLPKNSTKIYFETKSEDSRVIQIY